MKKVFAVLLGVAFFVSVVGGPTSASADFGLKDLGLKLENQDGSAAAAAGAHPFAVTTTFGVNTKEDPVLKVVPEGAVKNLALHLPPGFVGNPTAIAPCSNAAFTTLVAGGTSCPDTSAIGTVELTVGFNEPELYRIGLYNLEPPPGAVAKVGFVVLGVPVSINLGINPNPPYNVVALSQDTPQAIRFYGVKLSVWGNPASPAHDEERGKCFTSPAADSCPVALPEKPFITAPRSCTGPLQGLVETDSWENPDSWLQYPVETEVGMVGCGALPFAPEVTASSPTTSEASAPSGLQFNLDMKDEGLLSPTGTAGSEIKKAEVLLPEGVTVNPAVSDGLAACTETELARETAFSEPGDGCPQASKVGEVEVETPLLEGKILRGEIFTAAQEENPFHSLVALYMVIKNPQLGIFVKLPGRVNLDPTTGQLRTTFGEPGFEIPQFPFSHLRFRFRGGPRAPLVTPPACGRYETTAVFTPWANPAAPYSATAAFEISSGAGGGPCPPSGAVPFEPVFSAGSISNAAGTYSPFYLRVGAGEGQQDLTRFSTTLPPGVAGKIAGLAKCSDAAITAAKQSTGRMELAFPSCPADSKLGDLVAGSGAGSALTWVAGSLYLAGPVGGDPLSVVAITPAVAGPFDIGTVVVREGLNLNPETGEVEVDGLASDPIPHILEGIPLRLRDLRVNADRPDFALTPTSCDEEQAKARLFGSAGAAVSRESRYQAASCASLHFRPKLSLTLKGGTKRGSFPALTARVTYPAGSGYSNLARAVVTLPHSAFLEQGHIRTVCTRVQFAADQCPPGSIYGWGVAVTPLLDEPLEGPVYLRSNGGERQLPDLVVALHGVFDFNLVGYVDAVHARLRTRFLNAPDVPVSSFTLKMQGGRKGLIVNSRDLCLGKARATELLVAHNGLGLRGKPPVRAIGCKKKPSKR